MLFAVAPKASIIMHKIANEQNMCRPDPKVIAKALKQCILDRDKHGIDIVLLSYRFEAYNPEVADARIPVRSLLMITMNHRNKYPTTAVCAAQFVLVRMTSMEREPSPLE